jgi:hypothetical protein
MSRVKEIAYPIKPPRAGLRINRTSYAQVAAEALMQAFDWDKHPWGRDYWRGVHAELTRVAATVAEQEGPSK